MNALRKISIDTVLLALAVALCVAGLVWLGGAHAWIAALGVGVFVAAQEAPQATKRPRCCATCSRPLDAWQLRFDGGAELRCGRSDCAAKDKLVARREVQADGTVRETAANHARAPLDVAALRTLVREARGEQPRCYVCNDAARGVWAAPDEGSDDTSASLSFLCSHHGIPGANDGGTILPDVPALASAVERLCDALEAKAPPRAQLDADELAIIERTRALVRERDELRASVALLDEQGRKMKAERDDAREASQEHYEAMLIRQAERDDARAELTHYTTLLRESAPDIDKALEGSRPPDLKDHNAWTIYAFIATLTGLRKMEEARMQQRDEARAEASRLGDLSAEQQFAIARAEAEIERMKPLVEAALKWDEEGASDDELLQAAQDYRDAEEGAL